MMATLKTERGYFYFGLSSRKSLIASGQRSTNPTFTSEKSEKKEVVIVYAVYAERTIS